jgi:hypothetical protein
MTAPRRSRNSPFGPALVAFVAAIGLFLAISSVVDAATTERIVINPRTGLAIHGFDPVAYFTDRAASAGRAELELSYAGVVWRFRNPGNRAAFADHPGVYMPQFGGYDPVVLAQQVAIPGHPQLWLIAGGRLYLFHTADARDAFAADPRGAAEVAEAKWPGVLHSLVP